MKKSIVISFEFIVLIILLLNACSAPRKKIAEEGMLMALESAAPNMKDELSKEEFNTESYSKINENTFLTVSANPLSTFSIDVDKASYSNVRRFLNSSTFPPVDAVRIEELINYFDYDYPQPVDQHPFSVSVEAGKCYWNSKHLLLNIGIKGKEYSSEKIPASNFVFLIDVSGSMNELNKLPLLKKSFMILIDKLRPQDKVAIVTYAGSAGVALESTSGEEKDKIRKTINNLTSEGSTAGAQGIEAAYAIAEKNFITGGNNRIILATDGDFNVGMSSDAEMERLIEQKRTKGIYLTILGFGMYNLKDSKMEMMADAGNGNFMYIDNILEADKVFGKELWGTLFTIAKDVKIQIEFNPEKIKAYRLIGYENRKLKNEDFNNDKKDAGDIGAGHCVTAIYELIPAESEEKVNEADKLEYQKSSNISSENYFTLKLRYKDPDKEESKLITKRLLKSDILASNESNNFKFSASVAAFGMLLRNSEFKGTADYPLVRRLAQEGKGKDVSGYRAEFLRLVDLAETIAKTEKK